VGDVPGRSARKPEVVTLKEVPLLISYVVVMRSVVSLIFGARAFWLNMSSLKLVLAYSTKVLTTLRQKVRDVFHVCVFVWVRKSLFCGCASLSKFSVDAFFCNCIFCYCIFCNCIFCDCIFCYCIFCYCSRTSLPSRGLSSWPDCPSPNARKVTPVFKINQ